MSTELSQPAPPSAPASRRPTREELLADFGQEPGSVQSLFEFCFVPAGRLNLLRELQSLFIFFATNAKLFRINIALRQKGRREFAFGANLEITDYAGQVLSQRKLGQW